MRSERLASSTAALDAEEAAWWNRFSPVNERLWGLDEETASALRDPYLGLAANFLASTGARRVLDAGCGSGFVSRFLASRGFDVLGIDVSDEQVRLARAGAREAGLDGRASFEVAGIESVRDGSDRFDAVVTHAFLHHLAADELDGLLGDIHDVVAPGGAAWFLEPVFFPPGARTGAAWSKRLERYGSYLAKRAASRGRLMDEGPLRAADEFYAEARRNGYFLSPKEVPFTVPELMVVLGRHFQVADARWTMAASHATAQWVTLITEPALRSALARGLVGSSARWEAWLGGRAGLGLYRGLYGYGFVAASCLASD